MSSSDFEWGIKNGDLEKVKEAVEKGVDVNAAIDGRIPLCLASDYGQLDVLNFLLSRGADVDVSDKFGVSPLLAAIYEGHTQCVQSLLKAGAKKDGRAPDGSTYLEAAEKEEIKALLS
ncbi:Ankyrin repeat-containing domain [Trinorchestia longiramus]|nr:Ankyrin repeat-containing domain [Trinorchestia longiramus]